eukprot:Lithocolla_globosa_v1_NODE_1449_length_2569_cov_1158.698886.p4 type:complete len:155 gc:universal NODE_1449_length_2569_cov_1158.698886:1892-1428(-)
MEVMTRLFEGNKKRSRTLWSSPTPNTEVRMILAEFLWKSSKATAATAPRMREAMALQASPIKSGTEKIFLRSSADLGSHSKCQLYDNWRDRRAWSEVSMVMMSVQKSGPSSRHSERIWLGRLGLPPDRLRSVNCSSGCSITSSGPNSTRAFFSL